MNGDKEAKRRMAQSLADKNIPGVNPDVEALSHMISTDLRDTIPPQIYALIAGVAWEIKHHLEEE